MYSCMCRHGACVCVCACIHVIYNYVILYKIENQDTGADMVCESVCLCSQ